MKPKTTLTITGLIGLVFSLVMFVAPEFVTREQFPNAEGQGFTDLVTVRYAIASLIMACLLYTSPSPRDVEESRMPSSA